MFGKLVAKKRVTKLRRFKMVVPYLRYIKRITGYLGIEELSKSIYDGLGFMCHLEMVHKDKIEDRYKQRKRFKVSIDGETLLFSTEDSYSRNWFFPRYDGGKLHEEQITLFILNKFRLSKCFANVGTNLGWYLCLAARFMTDGLVYGFEMDELNYRLAKKNILINSFENVHLRHAAVAEKPGIAKYVRQTEFPSSMFKMSSDGVIGGACEISVEAISLDSFFQGRREVPDMMLIDVEGAEYKVLRGMEKVMKNRAPTLFVEVHPQNLLSFATSSGEVVSLLLDNGYQVFEMAKKKGACGKMFRKLNRGENLTQNTMLYASN